MSHVRHPSHRVVFGDYGYHCYPTSLAEFQSLKESLRHEFHGAQASIEVTWSNGNRLVAFWPEVEGFEPGSEPEGYFFLQKKDKQQPKNVVEAKSAFPRLGVVPILSPLDHSEVILNEEYVRRNVSSRLSSRHFRNQLLGLERSGELSAFKAFAESWLPGMEIGELESYESGENEYSVDLYLGESGSRVPKEAIWAGDGIQVWLQILYHVYRLREHETIVLDEPDVYLHADLQRRLVQLLESTGSQTIIATHSAEVVTETPRANVIWVDKSRKNAVSIRDEALLGELTSALGTSFNLKLAKAMKSKVLLMVEGKDMQILRRLSQTLQANRLAKQDGISVVSLQGFSRNDQIAPFKWILSDFLNDSVQGFVLLDGDYRPLAAAEKLEAQLRGIGVNAHVWRRKELESYLIVPAVIARISGAGESEVRQMLDDAAAAFEDAVFSRMLNERISFEKSANNHGVNVTEVFKPEFERRWIDLDWRLEVVPPKKLISALNARLQAAKYKTVSAERIAASIEREEIPAEMRAALLKVERAAD